MGWYSKVALRARTMVDYSKRQTDGRGDGVGSSSCDHSGPVCGPALLPRYGGAAFGGVAKAGGTGLVTGEGTALPGSRFRLRR